MLTMVSIFLSKKHYALRQEKIQPAHRSFTKNVREIRKLESQIHYE